MKFVKSLMVLLVIIVLGIYTTNAQVSYGQADDFEDATVMGWIEGASSPNPPQNVADGGPQGSGDNYLENVSAGGFGAGSKMVMDNESQWTGDFITAEVTYIYMHAINLGATELQLRISVTGDGGRFSTTNSTTLPVGSGWQEVNIPIGPEDFIAVGGTDINATLNNVTKLRILSHSSPSWQGESIAATLGVDNITASDAPLTVSGEDASTIIENHLLMQNYPNPFNPNTTINYQIIKPGNVQLILFDILGKELQVLAEGFQQPNNYSVNFNAAGLASGIYFYQLKVDNQIIATRKMMLMK